jgi:hypothetical protein
MRSKLLVKDEKLKHIPDIRIELYSDTNLDESCHNYHKVPVDLLSLLVFILLNSD